MKVHVKFFAMVREKVGQDEMELELPPHSTTHHFWETLLRRYPALEPYQHQSRLAVNRTYIQGDHPLSDGDEITIIPPVSGG